MSLLAAFSWGQVALGVGLIIVCGLLILVILVQQASGGGLVGAFGGGGGGGAFGAKTGDVFTVITCALAGVYLFFAVIGNYIFVPPTVASTPAPAVTPFSPAPVEPGTTPTTPGTQAPPGTTTGQGTATPSPTPVPPANPATSTQPATGTPPVQPGGGAPGDPTTSGDAQDEP